ncbi:MAG: Hsp20/alpha crystallin family protein [Bacteroidetes bacterium]|nr:Hsp20/alpha crystallin family protein [Bacteroidota bacterium]
MKKSDKEKYEEKIRDLKKQVEDLEAEKQSKHEASSKETETETETETESTTGNILETLGKSFGLSGLIKSVSKMPEFQDRLAEIDDELKSRLSEGLSGEGFPSGRPSKRRAGGIPPGARGRRISGRPYARTKGEAPPEPSRQVDVFDEDDHVLVVCEIPGSDENKIQVDLEKDKLFITAETLHRKGTKFHKELVLPSVPEGAMNQSYRNGILRIKILKEKNE